MLFRIEAFQRLPEGKKPALDTPIELAFFWGKPEEVFRETFQQLEEMRWVRVVDGDSGRPISGPFNPAKDFPRRSEILPFVQGQST